MRQRRGGPALGALGQRGGEPGVGAHALARQQVVVDRLAQQRVPEPVALALVGHEHLVGDGLAQRRLDLGGGQGGHPEQQRVGDPAAGDARDPHQLLGAGGQLVEPGGEHVGEGPGQLGQAVRATAVGGGGGEELLGEVGVAVGAAVHVEHHLARDGPTAQQPEVAAELVGAERGEVDPLDDGQPRQLAEQRSERVAAVQVVGAVGGDHEHALVPQAGGDEAQQVAAGGVGPVQVLDDEQDGAVLRTERAEGGVDGVEQRQAVVVTGVVPGAAAAEQGAERGEAVEGVGRGGIGRGLAEGLGEGEVGEPGAAEVDALAGEDQGTGRAGALAQLAHQAGLADTGVAGDEPDART